MSPWVGRAMDRRASKRRNKVMLDEAASHSWLKIGTLVDYHAIIGGPITRYRLEVRESPWLLPSGQWVVMLKGKSGCVAVEAVTPHKDCDLLPGEKIDFGKGTPHA